MITQSIINKYKGDNTRYVESTSNMYQYLKKKYSALELQFNSLSDEKHFDRMNEMSRYIRNCIESSNGIELDGKIYSIEDIEKVIENYFFEFMFRYHLQNEIIQLIAAYVNPCLIFAFKDIKLSAMALAVDKTNYII